MPTATPTSMPLPLPATRLSIPSIGLNTSIVESYPKQQRDGSFIWDSPNYAAGHYDSSGNPGRTPLILACLLIQCGYATKKALTEVNTFWSKTLHFLIQSPLSEAQQNFVREWKVESANHS